MIESRLGSEVVAFSEMAGHVSMLRGRLAHFADSPPGVVGFEDCESPFTRMENKGPVTEKFPIRHSVAIQQ